MQDKEDFPLVSIIVPVYNVEKYIKETIQSVQKQTYEKWECICIDDASNDNSVSIIMEMAEMDARIKIIKSDANFGAAVARNKGIEMATGDYLAFLDADDLWDERKLEKQLHYMMEHNIVISCTSYGKIDECSNIMSKICKCKERYTYEDVLKFCPGNSTIVYNCKVLGKIYGPDIRKRNDFAMWLKVIRIAKYCYGIDEVLGYHRIRKDSISIKKRNLIKYQWQVYYKMEGLGIAKSIYLLSYKILQTLFGRNG